MAVLVSVAERQTSLRVLGDRVWGGDGTATAPEPFTEMPLVWERAYGGRYAVGERELAEERNPVGCGFLGERDPAELEGSPAPNLVDPKTPQERLGDEATPACFAPSAGAWLPRREFAGTYDAAWQKSRAPYLPVDFDLRSLHAPTGQLVFADFLPGPDPCRTLAMRL